MRPDERDRDIGNDQTLFRRSILQLGAGVGVLSAISVTSVSAQSDDVTADITASPSDPAPDEDIEFTAADSTPSDEIVAYEWDFDDGSTASGEVVTHSYDESGEYEVELTVETEDDETDSTTTDITVELDSELTADISTFPEDPELDDEISFNATGSTPSDEIIAYEWDFDDGSTASGDLVFHSYDESGEYEIELTVETDGETDSTTAEITVGLDSDLTADISISPEDPLLHEEIEFSAEDSTPSDEIVAYEWEFDDGSNDSGEVVSHSYDESGEYEVELTIETETEIETDTATVDVSAESARDLVADITATPDDPDPGDDIEFSAEDSTPSDRIVAYEWEFGDGSTASGEVVSHSYDESGEYEVELTVETETAIETMTTDISVGVVSDLTADITTFPDEQIPGETIEFSAEDSTPSDEIVSYEWDFGDGGTDTGDIVLYSYSDSGEYDAELTVKTDTATDTATTTVVVEPEPEPESEPTPDPEPEPEPDPDSEPEPTEIEVPGFGIGSSIAALGAAGYAIKRRLDPDQK